MDRAEGALLVAEKALDAVRQLDAAVESLRSEFGRSVADTISQEVAKAVAAIPVPKDGRDGKDGAAIKGDAGEDGRSVTAEDVRPLVDATVTAAVAAFPKPKDGADADPRQVEAMVRAAVAALPPPEKGAAGKDADLATMRAAVEAAVAMAVAALPPGVDGKDGATGNDGRDGRDGNDGRGEKGDPGRDGAAGAPGIDGKSVTLAEVGHFFGGEIAKWALEFEHRALEVHQRVLDRMQKPKDGRDGKDGVSIDDISLGLKNGRTVVLTLRAGEHEITREQELEGLPIYRGTYKAGARNAKGDARTWGGSIWMATKDTDEPPKGPSDAWVLIVKGGK